MGVWREAGWEGRRWGLTGSERKGKRREMDSERTNVGNLIESEWGKQMREGVQKQKLTKDVNKCTEQRWNMRKGDSGSKVKMDE